jgi:hypothetical protein
VDGLACAAEHLAEELLRGLESFAFAIVGHEQPAGAGAARSPPVAEEWRIGGANGLELLSRAVQ